MAHDMAQIWLKHEKQELALAAQANSPVKKLPADPFARSAVSSQRSLLAAQFSGSAVSIFSSKPGRAQGWAKGPKERPRAKGPKGPKGPSGPFGGPGW